MTSGIVYPRAVLELSRRYRVKNSTSAGAIAAAVVAAASGSTA